MKAGKPTQVKRLPGAKQRRFAEQGVHKGRLVLGTLIIVLLLIVSALAKNAYREEATRRGPVAQIEHKAPMHKPAPPPEEPEQPPLFGGNM
ncbi:MAG TPA: hypothetical protein VMU02_03360 [bacterium]|nr:hypothetical protein [bacterium]